MIQVDDVDLKLISILKVKKEGLKWTGITFNSTPAGRMMGLNEREWGQTGVTRIAATLGWTIDAPAATAYAVLPVGVDTINPGKDNSNATSRNLR